MRLKEILVIGLILLVTFILALIPVLRGCSSNENTLEESQETEVIEEPNMELITIKIEGEINAPGEGDEVCDHYELEVKPGISYGEILRAISLYLTGFSVIDERLDKIYDASTTIFIASSNNSINVDNNNDSTQICINTASKKELETLKGIGPSRSKKILEYRKTKKIESFSELKKLLGVSDDIIEEIKKQAVL